MEGAHGMWVETFTAGKVCVCGGREGGGGGAHLSWTFKPEK